MKQKIPLSNETENTTKLENRKYHKARKRKILISYKCKIETQRIQVYILDILKYKQEMFVK